MYRYAPLHWNERTLILHHCRPFYKGPPQTGWVRQTNVIRVLNTFLLAAYFSKLIVIPHFVLSAHRQRCERSVACIYYLGREKQWTTENIEHIFCSLRLILERRFEVQWKLDSTLIPSAIVRMELRGWRRMWRLLQWTKADFLFITQLKPTTRGRITCESWPRLRADLFFC